MGGRVYILSKQPSQPVDRGWDGTSEFNSFPKPESRMLLGGTILTVLRYHGKYTRHSSWVRRFDGRLQRRQGQGSLQASFLQLVSASTRAPRPFVAHSTLLSALIASPSGEPNQSARLANDGRPSRRGGGAHAGPRMGHRQGTCSLQRQRTPALPVSQFCLGASPHGAARPSRLGWQETADDLGLGPGGHANLEPAAGAIGLKPC